MQTSYDRVPYASVPYPDTHPIRLQAVGWLYGLNTPALAGSRVLEIGCATGGNLVPLAAVYPSAKFAGIDLSARQIDDAKAFAARLSLTNVDLRAMSVADVTRDLGTFDYIICHGVYSWVPADVRPHVLRICRENLSPTGVALVSYNTFPGWHQRNLAREVMLQGAAGALDETQKVRQARAFLEAVANSPLAEGGTLGQVLKAELNGLRDRPDSYVLHEYLERDNEPVYFREFAKRAADAGLQYLGDARINGVALEEQTPGAKDSLAAAAGDLIATEQTADFFRNRFFRRSLLCHADARLNRDAAATRVPQMRASAAAAPPSLAPADAGWPATGNVRYKTAFNHEVTIGDATVTAAMAALGAARPGSLSFDELAKSIGPAGANRERLAAVLVRCWTLGLVELQREAYPLTTQVSGTPRTSRVARGQATAGVDLLTSLRHDTVRLDPPVRKLLSAADGTRSAATIADQIGQPREWVERGLATLAKVGLMEG